MPQLYSLFLHGDMGSYIIEFFCFYMFSASHAKLRETFKIVCLSTLPNVNS